MKAISRRKFLSLTVVSVGAGAVAACAPSATQIVEVEKVVEKTVEVKQTVSVEKVVTATPLSPTTEAAPGLASTAKESPMLSELVASDALPPLEERIPEAPYMVNTIDGSEKGIYGGTLNLLRVDPYLDPDGGITNSTNILVMPNRSGDYTATGTKALPHIVEDYEVSSDSKVFTFKLRKGLKWSDGAPVTTADVSFAYEDVILEPDLTPAVPRELTSNGQPAELTVIDDFTFSLTFEEKYGGFPAVLAADMRGYGWLFQPKDYLKKYHIKYTSIDDMAADLKTAGLTGDEWWTLFQRMAGMISSDAVGCPTLSPWVIVSRDDGIIQWDRNAYYLAVDEGGRQLPYIDHMQSQMIKDPKMAPMKALNGEVDFLRETANLNDLPLYKEFEGKGIYKVALYQKDVATAQVLFNLSNPDPVWQQVVTDVRFRKAVSLCIDRGQIIDTVYLGQAIPGDTQDATYDPDLANQLLDEMGMTQKDAEGYRLGPDGNTFVIPFQIPQLMGFEVPTTQLNIEFLKAVGLKATMTTVDFGLWDQLGQNNSIQASIHWTNPAAAVQANPVGVSGGWVGTKYFSVWPAYSDWYNSSGRSGLEPPDDVKHIFELRDIILTGNDEERAAATEEWTQLLHDNYYWIGLVWPKAPILYASKLSGIVPDGEDSFAPFTTMIQTYFAN